MGEVLIAGMATAALPFGWVVGGSLAQRDPNDPVASALYCGRFGIEPRSAQALHGGEQYESVENGNTEQSNEPDAGGNTEMEPAQGQRGDAADGGEWKIHEHEPRERPRTQ